MNRQDQVPITKKPSGLVIDYNFAQERLPVFWGPNQLMDSETDYKKPTAWKENIALRVPRVGRFIYDTYAVTTEECPHPLTYLVGQSQTNSVTGTAEFVEHWKSLMSTIFRTITIPNTLFKNESWRILSVKRTGIVGDPVVETRINILEGEVDNDGRYIGLPIGILTGGARVIEYDAPRFTIESPVDLTHVILNYGYYLQTTCGGEWDEGLIYTE